MFSLIVAQWLAAIFLVSLRLGVFFIVAPVFGSVRIPVTARILLVVALALGIASGGTVVPTELVVAPAPLAAAALVQVALGGILAAGLFAAFGAFQFAGRMLDLQIGFGVSSLVDPGTRTQGPLLGILLSMMAVLIFFLADGHHVILKMLVLSLERLPLGAGFGELDIGAVVGQFGAMFTFGLMLVAPVVFGLFLVDVGVAVISRTMPQMNVFVLALSAKAVVGVVLLGMSVRLSGWMVSRVFESTVTYWHRVLG